MPSVSDMEVDETGHHIELYGPPKGGKTLLGGQLAEYYKVHWIDVENGWKTFKQLPMNVQENIELYRIKDNKRDCYAAKLAESIVDRDGFTTCCHCRTVLPLGTPSCAICKVARREQSIATLDLNLLDPKKDIIGFDSLTQLSMSCSAATFGKSGLTTFKKLDYDKHAEQGFNLDSFLNYVQMSEFTWVCCTHEENLALEDGKEKLVPKAGTRNFSRQSARYFDHVVYVSLKNGKHNPSSLGVHNSTAVVGTRSNVNLESPTSRGLIELIQSAKGSANMIAAQGKLSNSTGVASVSPTEMAALEKDEPKVMSSATADKLAALKNM